MAHLLLRLPIATLVVLLSLAATATARPCRTFVISSYSFRNPSTNTVATITEIRSVNLLPLFNNDKPYDLFLHQQNLPEIDRPRATSLGFSSSLRDRTKDILSVALALLFGLGCGALITATMYLVSSVFSSRHDYRSASPYDDFSDDDLIESPKKMGYVKIPAAEVAAPAPAPAKDSV